MLTQELIPRSIRMDPLPPEHRPLWDDRYSVEVLRPVLSTGQQEPDSDYYCQLRELHPEEEPYRPGLVHPAPVSGTLPWGQVVC